MSANTAQAEPASTSLPGVDFGLPEPAADVQLALLERYGVANGGQRQDRDCRANAADFEQGRSVLVDESRTSASHSWISSVT